MKTLKYCLLLCVQLAFFSWLGAQEKQQSTIPGATRVLYEKDGVTPRFVNFSSTATWDSLHLTELQKQLFGSQSSDSWLKIKSESDDLGMVHTRFQQQYKQINVEGNVFIFHSKNAQIVSANGHFSPAINLSVIPEITKQQALEKAIIEPALSLDQLESPAAELVILNVSGKFILVYKCSVFSRQPLVNEWVFVDAANGKVVKRISRICEIDAVGTGHSQFSGVQTITTDNTSVGNYSLRETGRGSGIETINSATGVTYTDTDNNWNNVNAAQDEFAIDVHFGAEATYDFYYNNFNRDSYDNAGGYMLSYANDQSVGVNAYWSGAPENAMHYGNGDANYFPVASLEVAAHEMTHGVTENSAGLIYDGESGALNESFSDIFGNTIRFLNAPTFATWYIGDQLLRPNGVGDAAFRNMSNPNEFLNPDTYGGLYFNSGDIVHYDSGIQNFWYYLLVEGGTGTNDLNNNYAVTGIGLSDAMKISYRNLAFYLTPSATFMDARDGAEQSAIDLFGLCSPQQFEVIHAWYAVGVGSPNIGGQVIAAFTVSPNFACAAPLATQFTSQGSFESYSWDFGDGATSVLANPAHTYTNNGNYTVSLTVSNVNLCPGTDHVSVINAVVINPINPVAAFTPSPTITNGISTTFTDASLNGPTSWEWNFGDGGTSTQQNPTHTFANAGLFDVELIVHNCAGADTVIIQVEVTDIIVFCETTFTNKQSGTIYDSGNTAGNYQDDENCTLLIQPCNATSITLTVEDIFIEDGYDFLRIFDGVDASSPLLAEFTGMNTQPPLTSTSGSMFLTFESDFSVNELGFKVTYSSISNPGSWSADFNASNPSPHIGEMVVFTDMSSANPASWSWDFGDGGTSALQNPTHAYAALGTYTVVLTVIFCDGSTESHTETVLVNDVGLSENINQLNSLLVFPNPFDDYFTLLPNQDLHNLNVTLTDLSGRKVYAFTQNQVSVSGVTLSPKSLSSGQYMLEACYETEAGKMVIERQKLQVK